MDKKSFVLLTLVIGWGLFVGYQNSKYAPPSENGWTLATHEDFNFSIEYPARFSTVFGNESGYKGADYVRFVAFTKFGRLPRLFSVGVETRSAPNPTLQDVIDWSNEDLDEIRDNPVRAINAGFEEILLVKGQIDDTVVYHRRYAHRKSNLLFEELYIARESDMVIITLRADEESFDDALIIFSRMLESFEPLH